MSIWEHLAVNAVLLGLGLAIYALGVRQGRAERRASRAPSDGLPTPFAMRSEEVRAGFDQVRSSIPVDDEELGRAKPARLYRRDAR